MGRGQRIPREVDAPAGESVVEREVSKDYMISYCILMCGHARWGDVYGGALFVKVRCS